MKCKDTLTTLRGLEIHSKNEGDNTKSEET